MKILNELINRRIARCERDLVKLCKSNGVPGPVTCKIKGLEISTTNSFSEEEWNEWIAKCEGCPEIVEVLRWSKRTNNQGLRRRKQPKMQFGIINIRFKELGVPLEYHSNKCKPLRYRAVRTDYYDLQSATRAEENQESGALQTKPSPDTVVDLLQLERAV